MLDMSMFAINGLIAAYLARQFGVETFGQYIIITSFVSVLTMFTRGIQTSIAEMHSNKSMILEIRSGRIFRSEIQALVFGLKISAIWILFAPLLVSYGNVSMIPTLSASIIPPVASMFAVVVGRLQGSGQFLHWRAALLLSTVIQIPLVFIADIFNSPLTLFIIILAIPISLISVFELRFFRPIGTRFIEHELKFSLTPGFVSVLAMSATQIPLVYARHEIPTDQSAPLIVFIYILGLFIGISSTLGFFLLPRYGIKGSPSSYSLKHHWINSVPLILFFLVYFPIGNRVVGAVIGSSFELRATLPFIFSAFLSSLFWSIYSSLIHERLNKFRMKFALGILFIIVIEFFVINFFGLQIEIFFVVHALVALLSIIFALFVTK
jgi:hypothetical protein